MHRLKGTKINPKQILTSYQRKMEAKVKNDGVILFNEDSRILNINSEYLILPDSVTDLASHELGEHLNAFTQQKIYTRALMGRIELIVEEARRTYYEKSDPIYRSFSASKMTETAKDRMINNDPNAKEYYDIYQDAKRQLAMVQYSLENIEDVIFMLSREISRRGADFSEENRNHNVGKIGR